MSILIPVACCTAIEMTPLDTLNVAGNPIPRVVIVLGAVTLVNLLFVVLFFKELKLVPPLIRR